jgi:AraC-like DNA-binding protein
VAGVYRECPPPPSLGELVECGWTTSAPAGHPRQVLPDGCMDLVWTGAELLVAGPDVQAFTSDAGSASGLRFRPGTLPGLLGVPAAELRGDRVPLADLRPGPGREAAARLGGGADPLPTLRWLAAGLAAGDRAAETAPWTPAAVHQVTRRLAAGVPVSEVADALGVTTRSLNRHSGAVFGYGPAVLRRVLRFRRAVALLRAGLPPAEVAARAGYADQPHLSREVRSFAGLSPSRLAPAPLAGPQASGANRSTPVASGSSTVA